MVHGAPPHCGCRFSSPGSPQLTLHTCSFHTKENKGSPSSHSVCTITALGIIMPAAHIPQEVNKDYTLYSVRSIYKMFPSMHECRVYPGYYRLNSEKQNKTKPQSNAFKQPDAAQPEGSSGCCLTATQAPAQRKGAPPQTENKQTNNNNDKKTVRKSRPSF